jgi:hypothetical protein
MRNGLCLVVQLALILVLGAGECAGQNKDKLSVLKKCESIFGKPIDAQANLFEVNSQFVLQPHFDAGDNLISLEVVPKYFFEKTHHEWTEPDDFPLLSESQYRSLLLRFDACSPRGKLVATTKICVVTNSTCNLLDRYEYGYVRRGRFGKEYRYFSLYPFHEIEGEIIEKAKYENQYEEGEMYRVLVGELNYFVRLDDYEKLRIGQVQKFPAVGPIKGFCFAGLCNP